MVARFVDVPRVVSRCDVDSTVDDVVESNSTVKFHNSSVKKNEILWTTFSDILMSLV